MKAFKLLVSLVLISCTTTPPSSQLSESEGDDLEHAAKLGDEVRLNKLLSAKRDITEADRFWLMFYAVNEKCNTKVVEALFKKKPEIFRSYVSRNYDDTFGDRLNTIGNQFGSGPEKYRKVSLPDRPGAVLVSIAGKNFCKDAFKLISKRSSPEDFAIGIYKPQENFDTSKAGNTVPSFLEHFERTVLEDRVSEAVAKDAAETGVFAAERIISDCAKFKGEPCEAEVAYRKIASNLDKVFESRDYAASSQGILDEVCNSYAQMRRYLNLIKEEREKGKISGYVNIVALKSWGDSVYQHKQEYEHFNKQYKAMTKKTANPKTQCGQ